MKKIIPVILIVVIAGGVFLFINQSTSVSTTTNNPANTTESGSKTGTDVVASNSGDASVNVGTTTGAGSTEPKDLTKGDEEGEEQDKPAAEAYKSAEEAMKAIKNGAVDYDDRILEQFTLVGEDCTWCDAVYSQVKSMLLSPETPQDQRSYYGELLAVSGRASNVASLIDAIKNAPNQEIASALGEALELTIGKDDVAQLLGDQLPSANDELKESLLAALTNQGSRLSLDLLYKQTVEKGDPDGYYSLGIGIGELVPDETTMPVLQELVAKRDQYSHLAVKSLLNNGIDGLKLVLGSLTNSPNPEFDQKMLKDAIDHVPFDDEIQDYLKKRVETEKDPVVLKFVKDILENIKNEDAPAPGEEATFVPEDEQDATPAPQSK